MLMGVFTLQSCVRYRIKVVDHGSMKYYHPQKRILFSWEDMNSFYGHDLKSAKERIDLDRNRNVINKTYINY